MAEKQGGMEMLSALMGEQGQDALRMIQRMERLKRLMGPQMQQERQEQPVAEQKEEVGIFARNAGENMITAAIPFLNQEYQKNLYIVVKVMEMRRVLSEGLLEARGRQEEPPALRRRKLLGAVRPYLPQEERNQLDTIIKVMDMSEMMGQEGLK